MTCRRRPGSGPTSTPTTALNATTAGRRHGYGRCAGSNRTAVPRSCWPGHALVQNLRRGHDELAIEEPASLRVATAFDELALAI